MGRGAKGDLDFWISVLVKKNPDGTDIKPLWWISVWNLEDLVSQIHSPHLHVAAPGIFSDLLRSVQMLKREWSAESNGKVPRLFNPLKLQPWFLNLWWKTCLRQNCNLGSYACSEGPAFGQNTLMMMMMIMMTIVSCMFTHIFMKKVLKMSVI